MFVLEQRQKRWEEEERERDLHRPDPFTSLYEVHKVGVMVAHAAHC